MNDMVNYLTTKNRLLVAILAFILPFSFAKAEVKEVYSPALHGKRQGSICHDEKVAYRPLIIYGDICNLHLRYYIFYDMAEAYRW